MKNIMLCFIALCFPLFTYAQFSKGDATFGLDLEANRDIGLLSANYGRFVSDHLLVGNGLNSGYFGSRFTSFSYFNIGVAPYIRYYFNPQQQNNYFYTQATYAYTRLLGDLDDDFSNFAFQLGFDYFVAPGVAITAKTGLLFSGSDGNYAKNLEFRVDLSPYLSSAFSQEKSAPQLNFQKGSLLIGGTQFNILRSLDYLSWSLNFNPRVGYFFGKRFVAGAEIGFQSTKGIFSQSEVFTSTNFTLSPFVRYYLTYPKRFSPFMALELPYRTSSSTFQGNKNSSSDIYPQIGLGVNYFITPNLALEGILHAQYEYNALNLSLQFGVNVQYFIH